MASQAQSKDRVFLAAIGDDDSVTGLLLAGIGHVSPDQKKNFFKVDSKTETKAIEDAFVELMERPDIGILLINQHVADRIRHLVNAHRNAFPTILEIPSKDHPYDPEKDSVMMKVRAVFGE